MALKIALKKRPMRVNMRTSEPRRIAPIKLGGNVGVGASDAPRSPPDPPPGRRRCAAPPSCSADASRHQADRPSAIVENAIGRPSGTSDESGRAVGESSRARARSFLIARVGPLAPQEMTPFNALSTSAPTAPAAHRGRLTRPDEAAQFLVRLGARRGPSLRRVGGHELLRVAKQLLGPGH